MSKENDINRENEGIKRTSIELEKAVTENSDKIVTSTASTIMEVKTIATKIEAETASKPTEEVQNIPQCSKNKDDAKVNNDTNKINIRFPRTIIQDVSMRSVNLRQNGVEVEIESESTFEDNFEVRVIHLFVYCINNVDKFFLEKHVILLLKIECFTKLSSFCHNYYFIN